MLARISNPVFQKDWLFRQRIRSKAGVLIYIKILQQSRKSMDLLKSISPLCLGASKEVGASVLLVASSLASSPTPPAGQGKTEQSKEMDADEGEGSPSLAEQQIHFIH